MDVLSAVQKRFPFLREGWYCEKVTTPGPEVDYRTREVVHQDFLVYYRHKEVPAAFFTVKASWYGWGWWIVQSSACFN